MRGQFVRTKDVGALKNSTGKPTSPGHFDDCSVEKAVSNCNWDMGTPVSLLGPLVFME